MQTPLEAIPQAQPLDEHNQLLVSRVHPPEWENPPPPPSRHQLVVVGAGTAGLVTAIGAASLGARVALIERNLMGGDCLNSGCVPSKALIRAAHAAAAVRDAAEFGVRLPRAAVSVDFARTMERMRKLRAGISDHDSARRFSSLGVDVYFGDAEFVGPQTVRVGDLTLEFAKACIATGTKPALPAVPGLAEADALTNESVFSLTGLPRRLAVIGGGPIGVEMAQSFARFGAEVTLIQSGPGILPREDRDAAESVERSLRRDGVALLCGSRPVRIATSNREHAIEVETQPGGDRKTVLADRILVAAGRVANVANLGLSAAGVAYDERRGVEVNDRLRTSNPRIYAAGDVCSAYKFTHMADATARIVIANALFFGRSRASRLVVPWCTFSDPEVAHVGLHEREAEERNLAIDTYRTEMAAVDRAVLDSEADGFVKIHCQRGKDTILGATIVARHAGEMISEVTAAMTAGLGLRSIANTIHPYPTQAEALRKTADAYQRTRLSPAVRRLLRTILRWHG